MAKVRNFGDPHDSMDLPGAEGWREMYPYHMQFHNEEPARTYENSKFWFNDTLHNPTPMMPLEAFAWDAMVGGYPNARALCTPPTYGMDRRILNGYNYCGGTPVTDPKLIEKRAKVFAERSSFEFENWNVLYGVIWQDRIKKLIDELRQIKIPEHLPEVEDIERIRHGTADSEGLEVLESYAKMMSLFCRMWSYHHWFNTPAYFTYVKHGQTMKQLFPGISGRDCSNMIQGFDAAIFRPLDELRNLARKALEKGVGDAILNLPTWTDVSSELAQNPNGIEWLNDFEAVRDPWFEMSTGTGFYDEIAWNDDLNIPLKQIKTYIESLKIGEPIDRPTKEVIKERDEIIAKYRAKLTTDEDRALFDSSLKLAIKIAPYAEDHNFWCENCFMSKFYRKIRELGQLLVNHSIIENSSDIWLINQNELYAVIGDLRHGWYTGTEPVGKSYWPAKIARRKEIMDVFRAWKPEPAFGPAPEEVTDATLMALYGVTDEAINIWWDAKLAGQTSIVSTLEGFGACTGVVEGPARVCLTPQDISQLRPGEIMVAPTTSPTWSYAFQFIAGVVTDVGGVSSHAAIVAREYSVPAVVATSIATQVIRTGDTIRIDGEKGTVDILEKP
ncbi:MAG: PEP-utilizing enzyme [Desulfatiglandales bacterium]